MARWSSLIVFLFSFINAINCERIVSTKIFQSIGTKYFCVRRLNATHQFGCQSDFSGSIGVLHLITSESTADDVSFVISKGSTPPYIPVISVSLFSTKILESFRDSGRVSGLIVLQKSNTSLTAFSPDKSCPNDGYGLYSSLLNQSYSKYDHCEKQKWNPENSVLELFYRDFNFPVLLLDNDNDIVAIEKCISKYGITKENPERYWPLCSAELSIRMNAAKDSKTCTYRNDHSLFLDSPVGYCDPLGSFNVFTPFISINSSAVIPDKSLIVLATRLDAFSFFFDKTPGADSPITSIVTLLSIAETLGKIRTKIESNRKSDRNLLFSFFNGESFDYIGSGRTVYDLKNKSFRPRNTTDLKYMNFTNMTLNQLGSFIELQQLAPHATDDLYLHTDPISTSDPNVANEVKDLIASLQKAAVASFKQSPSELPLPPASLQSFLRENIKLPGVLISNHNGTFENKFYNSFADDKDNIKFNKDSTIDAQIVQHLASISTQISQSIYSMMTNETDSTIKSDPQTIKDLLYCFVVDTNCPYFSNYGYNFSQPNTEGSVTLPFYISIRQQLTSSYVIMSIIAQLLATYTGTVLDVDVKTCKNLSTEKDWLSYYFFSKLGPNGTCIASQVFATEAVSPVFITDEPDWSLPYSTWTESVWDPPTLRIFLQPSPNEQWFTLTGGLLITLASFLIVRFLRNQSSTLFKLPSDNGVSLMRENGVDC